MRPSCPRSLRRRCRRAFDQFHFPRPRRSAANSGWFGPVVCCARAGRQRKCETFWCAGWRCDPRAPCRRIPGPDHEDVDEQQVRLSLVADELRFTLGHLACPTVPLRSLAGRIRRDFLHPGPYEWSGVSSRDLGLFCEDLPRKFCLTRTGCPPAVPRQTLTYENGAPVGSRTPNLLIRSQMLYPIELRVRRRGREEARIRLRAQAIIWKLLRG